MPMPVRSTPFRPALAALATLVLAACAPEGNAPAPAAQPAAAATPAAQAAERVTRMTAAAQRGAWDAVAAEQLPACAGAADKPCAEAQALRARACRRLSQTAAADRRGAHRDCAVQAGQAALAAGGANSQAERNAWREDLLAALYDRRAVTPRASICPDNDLMRAEADTLLRDSPGNSVARFHGGNARMLGVSVSCGAEDQRCTELAEAVRLLTPPQGDTRWTETLEGVRTLQRVVVGCPGA
jgi:hypothetical protein